MTASSVPPLVDEVGAGRLDEVRDEVVAALQLDVDLREAVAVVVPPADEAVVRGDRGHDPEDDESE